MLLPAAAETADVSGSATESTTQTIDIYVTKAASFTVKVPVSITLEQSNGTGTASYSVFVKGDVEDGASVTVGPQADTISFKKTKGDTSATLTGSVTQAETSVAAADISTAYPAAGQLGGSISVSGITAGQWKGQMAFAIGYTGGSSDTPLNATALMDKTAIQTAAKEAPAVTFARKASAPSGTKSSVDVSAAKDGSVMAHTLSDGSVVIGADGGVLAPADMDSAFEGFKAQQMDVSGLDTRNVTNMDWMFSSCENLLSLDLKTFDTSKAISMMSMFSGCNKIAYLNVDNFNTQNVINMSEMFTDCWLVPTLNLCSFNVSKVNDSTFMFAGDDDITIYVADAVMQSWVENTYNFPDVATKVICVAPPSGYSSVTVSTVDKDELNTLGAGEINKSTPIWWGSNYGFDDIKTYFVQSGSGKVENNIINDWASYKNDTSTMQYYIPNNNQQCYYYYSGTISKDADNFCTFVSGGIKITAVK